MRDEVREGYNYKAIASVRGRSTEGCNPIQLRLGLKEGTFDSCLLSVFSLGGEDLKCLRLWYPVSGTTRRSEQFPSATTSSVRNQRTSTKQSSRQHAIKYRCFSFLMLQHRTYEIRGLLQSSPPGQHAIKYRCFSFLMLQHRPYEIRGLLQNSPAGQHAIKYRCFSFLMLQHRPYEIRGLLQNSPPGQHAIKYRCFSFLVLQHRPYEIRGLLQNSPAGQHAIKYRYFMRAGARLCYGCSSITIDNKNTRRTPPPPCPQAPIPPSVYAQLNQHCLTTKEGGM